MEIIIGQTDFFFFFVNGGENPNDSSDEVESSDEVKSDDEEDAEEEEDDEDAESSPVSSTLSFKENKLIIINDHVLIW